MAKILDQYGNPFNTSKIAEPQTTKMMALQYQLLESQLDGMTPERAARVLREADLGNILRQHELFEDIYDRDAHLRCEYDKRTGALTSLDWSIEPPENASAQEKKAASWVEDVVRNALDDVEDLFLALQDAIGHGFSAVELEWVMLGKERLPRFHARPQTWFRLDQLRHELRLADGSSDGAKLIPMGWIMHQARKVKTGYLGRAGLYRTLIWPFLYKAYSIGDFAEFLDVYGLPIIVGKYMAGANQDEKASLMRAVAALGRDARAIMPEGMQIEIQKVTAAGGNHNVHLDMVHWADDSQSKCILGQVLSAEAKSSGLGSGSGIAKLHEEVRHDILKSDARQVADTLTRDLIYPLIALNIPGVDGLRRCPRWIFDTGETDDMTAYSTALPKLVDIGMEIPAEWAHDKLRIPVATQGQKVLKPATPPAGAGQPPAALAALAAVLQSGGVDAQAEQMARNCGPTVNANVDQIRAMLESAGSLAEFAAMLDAAYPKLDTQKIAAAMAEGFASANLAGMDEVEIGGR